MEKFAFGLIASLVLLGGVAGGVYMSHRFEEVLRSSRDTAEEVSDLKDELRTAREEIQALAEGLRRPPAVREEIADADSPRLAPAAADAAAAPALAAVPHEEIRTFVAVALDEERKQRDEERKKQREEFRQQAEERRKENDALREGPYERFNTKVNSLAKALSLSDPQKQAYYELSKQTLERFQEARRAAARTGGGQAAPEAGRGKGREDRTAMRGLSDGIQKEFDAAVQGMLTPAQIELYQQLSGSARSFQSQGRVAAPGEASGPQDRFPPGGMRGRNPGSPRG